MGLDNIGIYGSLHNKNQINSYGLRLNISEFKIGYEQTTSIVKDNITETAFINADVSGWFFIAVYAFLESGQVMYPNQSGYSYYPNY